jgi:hypothetical protein
MSELIHAEQWGRVIERKTCPNTNLSTKNPTLIGLESNQGVDYQMSTCNRIRMFITDT